VEVLKRADGRWLVALGVIVGAGALMRLAALDQVPSGLHYDEAFNGLDAVALSRVPLADWPLFLTGNFGREPLFVYLLALLHRMMDPSIVTLRLVPAVLAALWTPAMAWLAWEAAPSLGVDPRDRDRDQSRRLRLAAWVALSLLGLFWGQIFARYAIRLSLFVLLQILFFAALWRAWRVNRPVWWIGAGTILGLIFYTYLPARLIPLALLPVMVLGLLAWRDAVAERRTGLMVGLAVSILVAAPLLLYFWSNPLSFTTRVGQTSLLAQSGGSGLFANTRLILGMFLGTGDANVRANLPGRPLLDGFMAVPFLMGAGLLLWRWRRPGPMLTLSAALVMTLPTLLSDNAPHFQRAIGLLPWLALMVGLGMDGLADWVARRWPGLDRAVLGVGSGLLLASVALTTRLYFGPWGVSPDLFPAWDGGFTQLAGHLAQADPDTPHYLSPRGSDHPSLVYLLLSDPTPPRLLGFDGATCVRVQMDGPADYTFLVNEGERGQTLLSTYLPWAETETVVVDGRGAPWAVQSQQPQGMVPVFPEMTSFAHELADGIGLAGYWLSQAAVVPGERLYARLFWQVIGQPSQEYTAFVHLLAQGDDGERLLAGSDTPPGNGTCATSTWRPGETIVDELQFVLPDPLPDLPLWLEIGLYDGTGTRLTVSAGETPGADRILIGPLDTQN
jgi:hypothetical protein